MVNEKTLEINVSTNMINDIRQVHPNAFVYGFDMRYEEPLNGLDTSLNLSGNRQLLAFQFKAPKKRSGNIFWYCFNNAAHNLQHNILHRTADASQPISTVYYALPAYHEMIDFENDSPNFLNNTYFVDILDTPLIFDHQSHQLEIDIQNMTFAIHSDSILGEGKIKKWDSIKKYFLNKEVGISSSGFIENILKFRFTEDEKKLNARGSHKISLKTLVF